MLPERNVILIVLTCILSVKASSMTDMFNPATNNDRAYKFNLKDVYDYALIEVKFLSQTNWNDRQSLRIKGGSIDKRCDVNLKTYKICSMIGNYGETDMNYRFNCSGPLRYVYIIQDKNKRALVGDVQLIDSKSFATENLNAVNKILTDYKKKYEGLKARKIPGIKYRGYFAMIKDDAIALAVSGTRPVIVQSKLGQGKVIAAAHYDYHSILSQFLDLKTVSIIDVTKNSLNSVSKPPADVILKWSLHQQLSADRVGRILELVRKGATLLVFITPWYYETYDGHLQDASWLPVLSEAGIWPVHGGIIWDSEDMTLFGSDAMMVHSISTRVQISMHSLSELKKSKDTFELTIDLPNKLIVDKTFVPDSLSTEIRLLMKQWEASVGNVVPCFDKRITRSQDKQLLLAFNTILLSPLVRNYKAPGYFAYPGDVDESNLHDATRSQELKIKDEVIPTGLYLAPGVNSKVTVIKGNSSNCQLIIGWNFIHISSDKYYRKWPKMTIYSSYNIDQQVLSSPFGGLIWLKCDSVKTLKYSITKVLEAPFFDLRNEDYDAEHWEKSRHRPSPWGLLAGETVVFVLPSASLRGIDDPSKNLRLLDKGIKEELYLVDQSFLNRRREVVSFDYQIKIGMMHSGYPIGAVMYMANPRSRSQFLLNYDTTKKKGSFGLFHEIGHNLVESAILFEGSEEVINNILAVRAEKVLLEADDVYSLSWFNKRKVENYLVFPKDTLMKAHPKEALTIFIQLADHFGWKLWHLLFAEYKSMPSEEKKAIKDKKETLIMKLSKLSGYNLIPLFELWGFFITEESRRKLSHLPYFLPKDKITDMSFYTQDILSKYPNVVRKVNKL